MVAMDEVSGSMPLMPYSPKPSRPGPPYNLGVRELVESKRRWSSPLNREAAMSGFRGWHERGFLPHRDEPGFTQFVTFHLADSFPTALRSEWEALLEIEDDRERRKQLEVYLDQGKGASHLQQPEIGGLVDETLRFHHSRWYELLAWVVMPNHVHVLFKVDKTPLAKIIKELKRHTAREANRILGRRGEFWASDYWDTYMRDPAHEFKTRRYIENNPAKAFLVRDPNEWPWSSARFRDDHGVLHL